jgi:transposase-like protein
MAGKRTITPELEQKIVSRYVESGRAGAVAKEFGINRKTVTIVVRRNGEQVLAQQIASGRRPIDTTPLHPQILELRKQGMSQQQIGREVGISQAVVGRALKKMGLPTVEVRSGRNHPSYKGGRIVTDQGYVMVLAGKADEIATAMANRSGYVPEHRLTMASAIGRPLLPDETVHHMDGDRANNTFGNLQLRQGKHGAGVVMVCCDCGSHNVRPTFIKQVVNMIARLSSRKKAGA